MNPYAVNQPTAVDPAAIADYTAGVLFAALAYDATKSAADRRALDNRIDYEARTAASEKQRRYRARKKEQQP